MPHSHNVGHPLFELGHERALVRKPASIEHAADPLEQSRAVAQIGPADMQRFLKGARAPQQAQVTFIAFHALSSAQRILMIPSRDFTRRRFSYVNRIVPAACPEN